jgi:hypothetical protein
MAGTKLDEKWIFFSIVSGMFMAYFLIKMIEFLTD